MKYATGIHRTMSKKEQEIRLRHLGYEKIKVKPVDLQDGDYIFIDTWQAVWYAELQSPDSPTNAFPGTTHVEVALQMGCYVSLKPSTSVKIYRKASR